LCSSTYNGQLLWDTVLDGWQAGILMVAGGRKDGWEERPRPPNPGWRLYGGSLSVRILIYAGTCRASQPLLHRAWNVWWQCRGCIAIYAVVCRASQPLLHHAWNVWWQCSNICAIYASGCRVAQHLLHRAWNVWWQCSYSTAIYASGCRACTALVQLCMEESGLWLGRYGNRSHDAVQTRSPAESAPARSSPAAKIPHSSI